ncbi:hypothetical protein F5Y13DRAFT_129727 [Hypoxylon sp. FL1857]|nr:hypothetical protein F5Y13DRAFT_129727 [Hypoxylon sp. FL1857]
MSVIDEIRALQAEAVQIISHPSDKVPTRAEYAAALEKADTALELARNARLSEFEIHSCQALQGFCYDPLQRSYSKLADYERDVYKKSTSWAGGRSRRGAMPFNTDPGDLLESFGAVRIGGRLPDEQQTTAAESRRIRWVDEVQNQPIRTVMSPV